MTQFQFNTKSNKGKHLSYEERNQIQILLKLGFSNRAIAKELGRSPQTINNEVKRGNVQQIKRQEVNQKIYEYSTVIYAPELAQKRYEENRKRCGAKGLWFKNPSFISWADNMMKKRKWSPSAVISYAYKNRVFNKELIPCITTLYSWINAGIMKTRNIDLFEKLSRKNKNDLTYHKLNKRVLGPSISKRPIEVQYRQTFGHWEIDTVIGTKDKEKPVILTLVERMTRFEILILIKDKTVESVSKALNDLFNKLGELAPHIFKSITSDNGSEFASLYEDFNHLFDVYFTHPFSSFERGTSENQHKLIRRFIPKGTDLSLVSPELIKKVQQYMNDYPRRSLRHKTAHEMMARALKDAHLF